ncbi:GNAT family N-acetyltransferase [Asanoa sp. WMMD1127]|uniref:GNAT family N-acetyltransferase n=1 Tax=Asanoa sp. WMMD1127 TaxID=3016107 RepID=UPI002417699D|nr:GNAT family N-acetyltransferase [Asanoa sp. WMMD1127]MDG4823695.1 GNAT family N-acetyltransferase [Asanoa sp. WMMD1127]
MDPSTGWQIRQSFGGDDREALDTFHEQNWGGPIVVVHDEAIDLRTLPALIATGPDGKLAGALSWRVDGDALEVVSIAAAATGTGVGTALLNAVVAEARSAGSSRVWLVTTNDNLRALHFYQRRGMRIVGVDPGAADRARLMKPRIPTVGENGIPVHDELRLELTVESQ